jgi:hypothetical protein
VTFSNTLPQLTLDELYERTLSNLYEAAEQLKNSPPIRPSPVTIISPDMWDFMCEQGWIDENGCYTEAFYRG